MSSNGSNAASTGAAARETSRAAEPTAAAPGPATPKVRWDQTDARTSYANVCNVTGTREELTVVFGMAQGWQPDQPEITVRVSERVVLSPFAAKRLAEILARAVEQYEARFGSLPTNPPPPR